MFELLETLAGVVVLAFYLGVAVVLPAGTIFLFVRLIGTLLRMGLDPISERIPERVRAGPLAPVGRAVRGAGLTAVGVVIFLALVGVSSAGLSASVVQEGFSRVLVTLASIQDVVATAMTGKVLNDMLVELQPASGQPITRSLLLFENLVAVHLFAVLEPGVTSTAFRWTFATFATGVAAVYLVLEPLRAVRRRLAALIAPVPAQAVLTEESLERQAELIAQALAKATPAAAAPAAPAQARVQWGRPGARPAAPSVPAAPTAVPSQRVAVVTWDGELASELERQLEAAGFAPLVLRSVAEAFASRVWPQLVFIDARHLQWLSPERLPLLVRARLVAVTRDDIRVPRGWQLDTHDVAAGADALLDMLRRREARRKGSQRESGA